MFKSWKLIAGMCIAGLLAFLLWWPPGSKEQPPEGSGEIQGKDAANRTTAASDRFREQALTNREQMAAGLQATLEDLRGIHGEEEGQVILREMMAWLHESPREPSVAAIRRVLQSGENALAFGRFAPGKDGFLTAHPSFRTALLDTLEQLDPAEAVEAGKDILEQSENPDEWAIALRTLARHGNGPGDRAVLHAKVGELLQKASWREDPTFSYLHAFDAAVAAGRESTLAALSDLVEVPPNKAVAHAATLSVDRFFQLHSAEGTRLVAANPGFLDASPGFRASLMARANPESSTEMQSVEAYLASAEVSTREKQAFFQAFPNFNSSYSYNLITGSLLLTRPVMRERSYAALTQLNGWTGDPRYSEFGEEIESARERLAKIWEVEL